MSTTPEVTIHEPGVGSYSWYTKGCRCEECSGATREYNQMRREKECKMRPLRGHTLRRLRKLVEQALEHNTAEQCALYTGIPERTFLRIRTDAKFVRFETAESIINGLYGPQKWFTDPVLYAYYSDFVPEEGVE
jgi:hypothetical protein